MSRRCRWRRPRSADARCWSGEPSTSKTSLPLIDSEYPDIREIQKRYGFRTVLNVPLLREGEVLGVISLLRNEVRPFAPAEIGLRRRRSPTRR